MHAWMYLCVYLYTYLCTHISILYVYSKYAHTKDTYFRPLQQVAVDWENIKETPKTKKQAQEKDEKRLKLLLREGYCFSDGLIISPELCQDFAEKKHSVLFEQSGESWEWDRRCVEAQSSHYDDVANYARRWDASILKYAFGDSL